MWWNKKVFGLDAALKAESLAAIPAEHATTAMAVLEAVGVPVTAGAEAAAKITELKDSVKKVEGDLRSVKQELVAAPVRARVIIDALRIELEKMIEVKREAVRLFVEDINDVRDAIVGWVNRLAGRMTDRERSHCDDKINNFNAKFSARIDQAEADLKAELAGLRDAVSQLEAESFHMRIKIGNLEPIAKKWTLPSVKK